jgi:hypothetical protein
MTKGSDLLTYEENITIFKHAFKYIKDSKRFTNITNRDRTQVFPTYEVFSRIQ